MGGGFFLSDPFDLIHEAQIGIMKIIGVQRERKEKKRKKNKGPNIIILVLDQKGRLGRLSPE